MSEERPRPAYGEYATPEEQRARIAQPSATWELETGHTLGGDGPATPAAAAPIAPVTSGTAASAPPRPPRMGDRIATIALLAYGLVNVVSSVITLADYPAYANSILALMGVDATYTDGTAARPWAMAASGVLIVGWLLTAALSYFSLRRGRLTWWIPVVAGIVFNVVAGTLVMVPLMSDPAVWDAIVAVTTP